MEEQNVKEMTKSNIRYDLNDNDSCNFTHQRQHKGSEQELELEKGLESYLEKEKNKTVDTMGVIIYKKNGKEMAVLITLKGSKYEDLCVKYEENTNDTNDTLIQGIRARTNNKINITIDRIQNARSVYIPRSKHLVFILEAIEDEIKLMKEDFGTKEQTEDKPRIIGWINRSELTKHAVIHFKLNQRIKSKELFDKLLNIERSFRMTYKLFRS